MVKVKVTTGKGSISECPYPVFAECNLSGKHKERRSKIGIVRHGGLAF
jgi:hypothetical protein